jgi:DNA primase
MCVIVEFVGFVAPRGVPIRRGADESWGVRVSGRFSDTELNEVAAANDIVEVIGSYLALKPAGKNFVALCPFHNEKTPSFNVSQERQRFKCFGCGKSGNVFGFIMEYERLTFPEAVEFLARRASIKLVKGDSRDSEVSRRESVASLNSVAQEFFVKSLGSSNGLPAREYLQSRGFDEKTIKAAGIGFSPDDWHGLMDHAKASGHSVEALVEAGLAIENDRGQTWDRFRNRVMFPIRDLQGRLVGFGARTIANEHPKYLNSSEGPLFNKSALLYGLYEAREAVTREKAAVLMEGYTDVIAGRQFGIDNCCATLGTSLTVQHIRLLKRFAERIILVYDGDEAGVKAAERALPMFIGEQMPAEVVVLPDNADPFDFLRKWGGPAFKRKLANSEPLDKFLLNYLSVRYDLSDPHQKVTAADALATLVSQVPEAIRREVWLAQFADYLRVDKESFRKSVVAKMDVAAGRHQPPAPATTAAAPAKPQGLSLEMAALAAIMKSPELLDEFRQILDGYTFRIDDARRLWDLFLRARGVAGDWPKAFWSISVDEPAAEELERVLGTAPSERSRNAATVTAMLEKERKATMKNRIADLRARIRSAESEGDSWAVSELLRDLEELTRRMKSSATE